jgi:hypothetical protein
MGRTSWRMAGRTRGPTETSRDCSVAAGIKVLRAAKVPAGVRCGVPVWRSSLRADCPAMLAQPACRRTRCVHFVHSAQTAAASQTTKHACPSAGVPAGCTALLGATQARRPHTRRHLCEETVCRYPKDRLPRRASTQRASTQHTAHSTSTSTSTTSLERQPPLAIHFRAVRKKFVSALLLPTRSGWRVGAQEFLRRPAPDRRPVYDVLFSASSYKRTHLCAAKPFASTATAVPRN